MSDEQAAVGGAVNVAPVVGAPNLDGDSFSPEQAFEAYQKRNNSTAESAEPATAETKLADEANAGPEEVPGETEVADQVDENLPSIDAPRSWTKEDKELFSGLPRETQERLAEHARSQERYFLRRQNEARSQEIRRQNEAAESKKALDAEMEQAKQARTQYEAKQSAYTKTLEDALQAEFGDIRTMADVRNLQANDFFRFQAWQVHQMELSSAQAEKQSNDRRATQERLEKRSAYEAEQNKVLAELVPDMADPKKGAAMRERAVKMLTDDLGLKMNQLQRWMADDTGHEILSNAAIQKLIAENLQFKEIKAAPLKAIPKPVPAVQKPGVAPARGQQAAETVQALRSKLSGTGTVEDAFALYQSKRRRATS